MNRGQAASNAKFVARGEGYVLLLTDRGEPVLALNGHQRQAALGAEREPQIDGAEEVQGTGERTVLRLGFASSNPTPEVQGEERLPGHSNYLIGNDPQKWFTDVPHYARVRYREVFPGVDVLYYIRNQQLEYDFIVQPGKNPDSVRIAVEGAEAITQGASGGLTLRTAAGPVRLHKPVAYQQGRYEEREVACDYVVDGDEVRFALGGYDRSKPLRIDPVLSYSAVLDADLRAIVVDATGNSYLAGSTPATNFPITAGVVQSQSGGAWDALIAKLDPTGSDILYATYLGGDAYDTADGIALDSNGNVIVAGSTSSADFPVSRAFQSTLLGERDAFVSKLDPTGAQLLYSSYLGGSGPDWATGIAVDTNGRVLVTGETDSSNFPTTNGAFQQAYGGGDADAFIAKLDVTKSGSASRLFSTYLGGSAEDSGSGIAVDSAGFALVTGSTRSTDFPASKGFQPSCASCAIEWDAFVTKLNFDGTALVYSTFLGGSGRDVGESIAVDAAHNAYIAGETQSRNFPTTPGAFQTSLRGTGDGFVTKLNALGSGLVYSSYLGGSEYDKSTGIAVDTVGNAFVTGFSYSTDFPTVNPLQGYGGGFCEDGWGGYYPCGDAFVAQMNASGSASIFSTQLGGGADDSAAAIAVDTVGNAYVAGAAGDAFPVTPNAFRMTGAGFVARISPVSVGSEATTTTLTSSINPSEKGQPVTFTAAVNPQEATGVMTFSDGGADIGSVGVTAGGLATFTHTGLSAGSHSLVAQYWGDARFAGSRSAVFTQLARGITLTAGETGASISRGGTATFPLTVDQTGTFTSAVLLSCSELPVGWSCGFSPATVPAESGPTQVALTVQTSSRSTSPPVLRHELPGTFWPGVLALLITGMCFFVARRKSICARPALAAGCAVLLLLAAGCGAGSSQTPEPPSQPATYGFTVKATSGNATTSVHLTITVR